MFDNQPEKKNPDSIQPTQQPQFVRVAVPHAKPYVTYTLLGFTVLVFLLQVAGENLLKVDLVSVWGAKYGPFIRQGELWRLLTPVFLHGSFLHIAFNMYYLFRFGAGLEARFGHGRFALLYFLSAFAGNVLSFLLTPNASIGASTAIFGLIAAEGVFIYQNRSLLRQYAGQAISNIVMVAAVNLFFGFTSSNVDNWGHIGGLLGGLIFTWFGGPRWKVGGAYPAMKLVDEREGHGSLAGTLAVLLFFIPLTILGWIWPAGN